jgi:hypothetical protein
MHFVEKACRGDLDAFEKLVLAHQGAVRVYRVRDVVIQVEDLVLDRNAGPVVGRIPRRA